MVGGTSDYCLHPLVSTGRAFSSHHRAFPLVPSPCFFSIQHYWFTRLLIISWPWCNRPSISKPYIFSTLAAYYSRLGSFYKHTDTQALYLEILIYSLCCRSLASVAFKSSKDSSEQQGLRTHTLLEVQQALESPQKSLLSSGPRQQLVLSSSMLSPVTDHEIWRNWKGNLSGRRLASDMWRGKWDLNCYNYAVLKTFGKSEINWVIKL